MMRFRRCQGIIVGNEDGLSLIEVMISLSLLLMVLSLAYSIYFFGIEGYLNNTAIIENQSNVRIAMDHITNNVRRTPDVRLTGSTLIIGEETYWLRADNILMNKNNQLSRGISDFNYEMPEPELLYVIISSIPDRRGKIFKLEAYFYLMEI